MEHFDLDYYGRLRDLPNDVIAREFEWRYPERANAAIEVCDRHAREGRGLAIRWLGIDGSTRDVTYTEARATTNRVANMLARHGSRRATASSRSCRASPSTGWCSVADAAAFERARRPKPSKLSANAPLRSSAPRPPASRSVRIARSM